MGQIWWSTYDPEYIDSDEETDIPHSDGQSIIFRETTTIGIRKFKMERTVLPRETGRVQLSLGELLVKKCTLPDGEERWYPEYESVAELAEARGLSYQQVMEVFMREGRSGGAMR